MKFLDRTLGQVCLKDLKTFPVLTLTGPRQSGKSTLLQKLLPKWQYVNLEEPHMLEFAQEDPLGFIGTYNQEVIIDEIQRVPKLLSQIQVAVDKDRVPGRFAVTGSHNLLLLDHVSQSLAGRTAIRHLLPLSYTELKSAGGSTITLEEHLLRGGYPLVHDAPSVAATWLDSYAETYVERDVRSIRNISDLNAFRRFLRLCAGRASQILDLTGIGNDAGLSHNTVKSWMDILETGFIAFRFEPYFKNFSKRIIKSPKIYFYDTGLLCRILDIRSASELTLSPFRGAVFENWCVVESLKTFYNRGERPRAFFWRDQTFEVDILLQLSANRLMAIECKSSATPLADFIKAPLKLEKIVTSSELEASVVYGGAETQTRSTGTFYSWRELGEAIDKKLSLYS